MQILRSRSIAGIPYLALVVLAAACGGPGNTPDAAQSGTDTVAATPPAAPPESGTATASADAEFLRMMSDHHQGLIMMANEAAGKGTQAVQAEARQMGDKQGGEQQEMLTMLQRDFGVSHQPQVTPSNQAMADSLSPKSGTDYDMTFHMNVIAHHREGIAMIDQHLPHLTNPQVRQMAERMKSDQQREIQELEGKMQH
jgi:uncharacterized protein (DUF305 family)